MKEMLFRALIVFSLLPNSPAFAQSSWTLSGNDINNTNSGLVRVLTNMQIGVAASLWGTDAFGGSAALFGFNTYTDGSGSLKAALSGNRAGYLLLSNSGMSMQVSTGTQVAGSSLTTMLPVMMMDTSGNIGIGSASSSTAKVQITQGTSGAPVTTVSHALNIIRSEQISADTQGAQNATLNVESVGNNTSVIGVNIAQPVALRGYATQLGSGDAVGIFAGAQNNGGPGYAAFGFFGGAAAFSPGTGAIGLGLSVHNASGNTQPYAPSGKLFFVGVDAPCSGANGCTVGNVVRATGNQWDTGFAVQSGAVYGAAYRSPNYSVDPGGNVVGLSFTALSDERLKEIKGPFRRGLEDIIKINPIVFGWKDKPEQLQQTGLSAQNVQNAIPEAVMIVDTDEHLGVSDRTLIASLINAAKELKADNDNLRACQNAWRCRLFGR